MGSLNSTMNRIDNHLVLTIQLQHNPYLRMTQTTDSVSLDVRKNVFLPYSGISDKNSHPTCMYTGIADRKVKCAHILPKSSTAATLRNLNIPPTLINSPQNLLWLCPGIEEAFDSLKISFIPKIMEGMIQRYVMVLWDTSCLATNLGVDTAQTIGDVFIENQGLNFIITKSDGTRLEHVIWKRLLANQAIWSHSLKHNEFPANVWSGGDFSSLRGDELTRLRDSEYVCSSMSIIQNEIAQEDEDDSM